METNNANKQKKFYRFYIDVVIMGENDEVQGRMLMPVAYYAYTKEEAMAEAHKVAQAMARGIENEGEGPRMYYSLKCDMSICYGD